METCSYKKNVEKPLGVKTLMIPEQAFLTVSKKVEF